MQIVLAQLPEAEDRWRWRNQPEATGLRRRNGRRVFTGSVASFPDRNCRIARLTPLDQNTPPATRRCDGLKLPREPTRPFEILEAARCESRPSPRCDAAMESAMKT